MRVAIIASPYPLEEAPAPPLGLTYVAAAFERAGADVRIFDYIVSRYTPEKLRRDMENFNPHVVGTSSVTLNFPGAAEILQTAKGINPDVVTVMGGPPCLLLCGSNPQRLSQDRLGGPGRRRRDHCGTHGLRLRCRPAFRGRWTGLPG